MTNSIPPKNSKTRLTLIISQYYGYCGHTAVRYSRQACDEYKENGYCYEMTWPIRAIRDEEYPQCALAKWRKEEEEKREKKEAEKREEEKRK